MLRAGGYILTFLGNAGVESVGGGTWLYTFIGNVGVESVGGGWLYIPSLAMLE